MCYFCLCPWNDTISLAPARESFLDIYGKGMFCNHPRHRSQRHELLWGGLHLLHNLWPAKEGKHFSRTPRAGSGAKHSWQITKAKSDQLFSTQETRAALPDHFPIPLLGSTWEPQIWIFGERSNIAKYKLLYLWYKAWHSQTKLSNSS